MRCGGVHGGGRGVGVSNSGGGDTTSEGRGGWGGCGERRRVWNNPGDHTIELEYGGDLDEERGEVCGSVSSGPGTRADTCDFDVVGPADEEGGVILPVEGAFEEVSAGAGCGAVNEGDSGLRLVVVDLDSLSTM